MAKGDLLGMITCPHCGLADGMRITEDKNGQPFGFCEAECDGQLRVGGKSRRVDAFYRKYPHIKKPGASSPGEPVQTEKPAATPAATPTTTAKPARAGVGLLFGLE